MGRQLPNEDLWQLLLAASKAETAVERAVVSGEPAHVAKYAFQLAQAFNTFYHEYPVIHEENREKRTFLLWMTDYFHAQLERTLGILGIEGSGVYVVPQWRTRQRRFSVPHQAFSSASFRF